MIICCKKRAILDGEYSQTRDTIVKRYRCYECGRTHTIYKKRKRQVIDV